MMFDLVALGCLAFIASSCAVVAHACQAVKIRPTAIRHDLDHPAVNFLVPVYDWQTEPYFAD